MKSRKGSAESNRPIRKRHRRLDCYEFYLWSMGVIRAQEDQEENVWDYIENLEKGCDVNGFQII